MTYRSDPELTRRLLLDQTYAHFDKNCGPATRALRDNATQLVPGRGVLDPELVFVGEAPGKHEDYIGLPFVGRSGRFLDELLELAGLADDRIWITNAVKYRPEGNRTPDADEMAEGRVLLRREMAIVRPKSPLTFVGLGRVACSAIASRPISVSAEHGSWTEIRPRSRLFISYHPSAGLRSNIVRVAMLNDFAKLGAEIRRLR